MKRAVLTLAIVAGGALGQQLYAVRPVAGALTPPNVSPMAAKDARFAGPLSIAAVDGGLVIADAGTSRVYVLTQDGMLRDQGIVGNAFPGSRFAAIPDGAGGAYVYTGSLIYRFTAESGLQPVIGYADLKINTNYVAAGERGSFYIGNSNYPARGSRIFQVAQDGSLTVIAGTPDGSPGANPDHLIDYYGLASQIAIGDIADMAYDSQSGTLFYAGGVSSIFAIDKRGYLSWFAGNPFIGFQPGVVAASSATAAGITGILAQFASPFSLKLAAYEGALFVGDSCRVYRITPDAVLRPYAGGDCGSTPDGTAAERAQFGQISGLAPTAGGVYVADTTQVKFVGLDAKVVTLAGGGTYAGDGGPAVAALLNGPTDLQFNSSKNLVISDAGNNRLRTVLPDGTIRTYGPAPLSVARSAVDPTDGSIVALTRSVTFAFQVIRISASGQLTTIAKPDWGAGIAVDSKRNIFITGLKAIQQVAFDGTVKDWVVDGGQGGLAFDKQDNLYHLRFNGELRKYTPDGKFTVAAQMQAGSFAMDATGRFLTSNFGVFLYPSASAAAQRISSLSGVAGVLFGANQDIYVSAGNQVLRFFPDTADKFAFSTGPLLAPPNGNLLYLVKILVTGKSGFPMNRVPVDYKVTKGNATLSWVRIESLGPNNTVIADYTTDAQGYSQAYVVIKDPTEEITLSVTVAGFPSASYTIQTAAAAPAGQIDGIEGAAVPLSIVTLRGANFAPPGLVRTAVPDALQQLPTTLSDLCVRFGDRKAGLRRVSQTVIEAQIPNESVDQVPVVVITGCGKANETTGPAQMLQITPMLPDLLVWTPAGDGQLPVVVASDVETGRAIGQPGSSPGVAMMAAEPVRLIDIFAMGLGATSAAPMGGAPLADVVTVTVAGVEIAPVALSYQSPGKYAVRIKLPATVPEGDWPVAIRAPSGIVSPTQGILSVRVFR